MHVWSALLQTALHRSQSPSVPRSHGLARRSGGDAGGGCSQHICVRARGLQVVANRKGVIDGDAVHSGAYMLALLGLPAQAML